LVKVKVVPHKGGRWLRVAEAHKNEGAELIMGKGQEKGWGARRRNARFCSAKREGGGERGGGESDVGLKLY